MQKEFKKGAELMAADLQEMADAITALEAGGTEVLLGAGRRSGTPGMAYYECPASDAQEVPEEDEGDNLNAAGLVRAVEYEPFLPSGRINAGAVQVPAPRVWDMEGDYVAGKDGLIPLPVYAKAVRDVNGKVWLLSELTDSTDDGEWQAATVARCTLPDGTPLALRVHTQGLGNVLCFELSTNAYY